MDAERRTREKKVCRQGIPELGPPERLPVNFIRKALRPITGGPRRCRSCGPACTVATSLNRQRCLHSDVRACTVVFSEGGNVPLFEKLTGRLSSRGSATLVLAARSYEF